LGGVRRRGHNGDWNVCSVLTSSCIERLFDVKPVEAILAGIRDT
jgi:hypothetical protein